MLVCSISVSFKLPSGLIIDLPLIDITKSAPYFSRALSLSFQNTSSISAGTAFVKEVFYK
jgi:hypothetical protein